MANDAFRFLEEDASVLGPFHYRPLSEDVGDGLRLFRFSDSGEPAELCLIWFEDHPKLICTRACFVDSGENPNDLDRRASFKAMNAYWSDDRPGEDDVN